MLGFRDLSLRRKLTTSVMVTTGSALLLAFAVLAVHEIATARRGLVERAEPRVASRPRQVPLFRRAGIELVKGIEHRDLVAALEKPIHEMRSDEAGATRDEDAHAINRSGAACALGLDRPRRSP